MKCVQVMELTHCDGVMKFPWFVHNPVSIFDVIISFVLFLIPLYKGITSVKINGYW